MPVDTSKYAIGGWYNGQQWNGQTLGAPGVINMPGVPGSGQAVSNQVVAQTNPANVAYLQQQQQQPQQMGVVGAPQAGVPGMAGIDVQGIYNTAFNTPEITAAQTEIDTKQKAYDDAQAIINDNPFYSEATRVGKAQKLTQQFNAEMTRLQDKSTRLRADAEIKVNLAMKQYDINNQAYKDKLSLFTDLVSSGGLSNASGADLANWAVQTGLSTSVIESLVNEQKSKKAASGTVLGGKDLQQLKKDISSWMTLSDLAKKYVGVFGWDEVLSVYNAYHKGDQWGTAQESPQEVAEMFGTAPESGITKADINKAKQLIIQNGGSTEDQKRTETDPDFVNWVIANYD